VSAALSLAFDGLATVLLVVAIVYMMVLNRRFGRLREVKTELERVLAAFGEATAKAEASIAQLRSASAEAGRLDKQDRERLDRTLSLRDDLTFMLERGNTLADRLEAAIRQGRERLQGVAPEEAAAVIRAPRQSAEPAAPPRPPPASETEQVLLSALRRAR